MEDENEEKCFNFFDITIQNNNRRYEFDVHRKPALTHVFIQSVFIYSRNINLKIYKNEKSSKP